MNSLYEPKENKRVAAARESFSGRLLTDRQFDDVMAITGIIEREIKASGAFKDRLGDYAYAFARSEKSVDPVKAETILRDLFKERTGQTMNQLREELVKREDAITDEHRAQAYARACEIGDMMENGVKLSFHRAQAHQAQQLAEEIQVTDACAKRLMNEEFKAAEGSELYDWGKELDERFYRPQIDAEKTKETEHEPAQERQTGTRQNARSSYRTRTGPR
jgi:hypothetical protein